MSSVPKFRPPYVVKRVVPSHKEVRRGSPQEVTAVSVSGGGSMMAVATTANEILLYSMPNCRLLGSFLADQGEIYNVWFELDDLVLAICHGNFRGGNRSAVVTWDLVDEEMLKERERAKEREDPMDVDCENGMPDLVEVWKETLILKRLVVFMLETVIMPREFRLLQNLATLRECSERKVTGLMTFVDPGLKNAEALRFSNRQCDPDDLDVDLFPHNEETVILWQSPFRRAKFLVQEEGEETNCALAAAKAAAAAAGATEKAQMDTDVQVRLIPLKFFEALGFDRFPRELTQARACSSSAASSSQETLTPASQWLKARGEGEGEGLFVIVGKRPAENRPENVTLPQQKGNGKGYASYLWVALRRGPGPVTSSHVSWRSVMRRMDLTKVKESMVDVQVRRPLSQDDSVALLLVICKCYAVLLRICAPTAEMVKDLQKQTQTNAQAPTFSVSSGLALDVGTPDPLVHAPCATTWLRGDTLEGDGDGTVPKKMRVDFMAERVVAFGLERNGNKMCCGTVSENQGTIGLGIVFEDTHFRTMTLCWHDVWKAILENSPLITMGHPVDGFGIYQMLPVASSDHFVLYGQSGTILPPKSSSGESGAKHRTDIGCYTVGNSVRRVTVLRPRTQGWVRQLIDTLPAWDKCGANEICRFPYIDQELWGHPAWGRGVEDKYIASLETFIEGRGRLVGGERKKKETGATSFVGTPTDKDEESDGADKMCEEGGPQRETHRVTAERGGQRGERDTGFIETGMGTRRLVGVQKMPPQFCQALGGPPTGAEDLKNSLRRAEPRFPRQLAAFLPE